MKETKIHDFKKSLKRGQKGETIFHDLFIDKVTRTEGFIEDFIINRTGKTIDLKTDYYSMDKTENFFLERYSYGDTDGGAHQALKKNVDYYVYFFPSHMEFFVFKTSELVKVINKICKNQYLVNVFNTSHTTRGYKVNRELLKDIQLNLEDIL